MASHLGLPPSSQTLPGGSGSDRASPGTGSNVTKETTPRDPETIDELRPFFSVIVTAYNRREYLRHAAESVAAQTIERSAYELLVVKNFADAALDAYLLGIGARLLRDDAVEMGAAVAHALREAHGRYIAFLDDDDAFLPDRLAHLREILESDPKVTFVRNAHRCMEADGRVAGDGQIVGPPRTIRLTTEESATFRGVRALYWSGAGMNNSTMVIERTVLESVLEELSETRLSMDHFYLNAALLRPGHLVIDATPLTLYRVHAASHSTKATVDGEASPFRRWMLGEYREIFRRLYRLAQGTDGERWARWTYLRSEFAAHVEGAAVPPPTGREYLEYLYDLLRLRDLARIRILALALLAHVAPDAAHRMAGRVEAAGSRRLMPTRMGNS